MKVFINQCDTRPLLVDMFENWGHDTTNKILDPTIDVVVFGENHLDTFIDSTHQVAASWTAGDDRIEGDLLEYFQQFTVFRQAYLRNLPMVGFGYGFNFLTVATGGSLQKVVPILDRARLNVPSYHNAFTNTLKEAELREQILTLSFRSEHSQVISGRQTAPSWSPVAIREQDSRCAGLSRQVEMAYSSRYNAFGSMPDVTQFDEDSEGANFFQKMLTHFQILKEPTAEVTTPASTTPTPSEVTEKEAK
jgi:hypothetical protein